MVAKLKFQREESSVNKEATGREQHIIDTCDELCGRKNVISNFCWTVKVSLLFFRETEISCARKGQTISLHAERTGVQRCGNEGVRTV